MLIHLLAYLGGALTILSPCVLPVLPFILARADQPFRRAGLPLLLGMALMFSLVAVASAFGGHWIVQLNQGGRYAAMAVFFVLGLTLIFPTLAEKLTRPLTRLGGRLQPTGATEASVGGSLLLGVSTGLLWTPCAGPILGLILAGAALEGPSARSAGLILAFAAGAASILGIVLFAGSRAVGVLKRSLRAEHWIRSGLGVAVILGVIAIGFGWDTTILTRFSFVNTTRAEERLIDAAHARRTARAPATSAGAQTPFVTLPDLGPMPSLDGAVAWLNSPPLTREQLRGKVVLVDFWTYSCINCLRALPYVKAWAAKYHDFGLVVIGVHTPEFPFERDRGNVATAVRDLGVHYPVAIDSDYKIWQAFNNEYWPAHYFIDTRGRIRHSHFGEGEYEASEQVIQQLLTEGGLTGWQSGTAAVSGSGVEAAAKAQDLASPETYIGYARAQHFNSPEPVRQDRPRTYTVPARSSLNEWGLAGTWVVGEDSAVLRTAPGKIVFRFHARDLHLVLGPGRNGQPVRFRVRLDGAAPGADGGGDVGADGGGVVREERLYQLIRQSGSVEDRTCEIEFLDPGVQAFAFTFG